MVNQQAKVPRKAIGLLIEQLNAKNHVQPDKGSPIKQEKVRETLKDCLLSKKKRNAKGVVIEQT